jgi:hypothetical protein
VASDHVGKEFIMWYLKSAFDAYEKVQGALTNGLSEMQAAAVSPVETIKSLLRNGLPAANAGGELEELRKRIAELESGATKKRARKPLKKRSAKKS